jgi:hypothetical protein
MNEHIEELVMMYGEEAETMIIINGMDMAFVGVAFSSGEKIRAVYDIDKMIDVLQDQGMSHESAQEYFDYKIAGSYAGEQTPIFMHSMSVNHK